MPTRALLQRIGFVVLPLYLLSAASEQSPWRTLAPGMDFAYVGPEASAPRIAVLRIDPKLWELDVMSSSRTGKTPDTPPASGARITSMSRPSTQACSRPT